MTNQEIESAVEHIKSDMQWLKGDSNEPYYQTLLSLAQLFLEASKGMPDQDKLTDIILKVAMGHHDDISASDENNACKCAEEIHNLYTAHLAGKVEGIEGSFGKSILRR